VSDKRTPDRLPFSRHPAPSEPGQPQTRAQLRFERKVIEHGEDWTDQKWRDQAPPQLRVSRWAPWAHLNGLPTEAGNHFPTLIDESDVRSAILRLGSSMLYYDCPLGEVQRIVRSGEGIQTITARKRDREHPFLRPRAGCVYLQTAAAVDTRLVALCVDLAALEPQNLICDPMTMPHRPELWPDEVTAEIGGPGGPFDRFVRGTYGTGGDATLVELVDALPYDRGDLALAGLRAGSICHLGPIPMEAVRWNDECPLRRPLDARMSSD
jgi:hypothetical protein